MTLTNTELPATIAEIKKSYGTGREYINNSLAKCYSCLIDIENGIALQTELEKIYKDEGFKKQKNH